MSPHITLRSHLNHPWAQFQSTYVRGYAFSPQGDFMDAEGVARYFSWEVDPELESLKDLATKAIGLFAVIIETKSRKYLIADCTRTYPLFYARINGAWEVADDAHILAQKSAASIDPKLSREFMCSGYMIGEKTLMAEIKQVQAQEIVALGMEDEHVEYFTYEASDVSRMGIEALRCNTLEIYRRVASRMTRALEGRTAIVPLSAGYDSRLVVTMLKEEGYSKVICFSYGSKTSYEPRIAREVARRVGYRWIYVPYTRNFIKKWFDVEEYENYQLYAGNCCSLPHIQDYLAVQYLSRSNLIPEDSVFIPGIAGDIFAGSQIPDDLINYLPRADTMERIKQKYLGNSGSPRSSEIPLRSTIYPYSALESFCVKEKVPKYVANSVRAYEYFGYDFLLPLMDRELLGHFSTVPVEHKNRNQRDWLLFYDAKRNIYDGANAVLFKKYAVNIRKNGALSFVLRLVSYLVRKLSAKSESLNGFDYFVEMLEAFYKKPTNLARHKDVIRSLSEIYLHAVSKHIQSGRSISCGRAR